MGFISYLFVVGVLVISALAQEDISSPLNDFVSLWQRKLKSDINLAELKIKAVDDRGTDNLKLLTEQQLAVEEEITRYSESLVPMQALSSKRKYCVQQNMVKLVTVESARAAFSTCLATAQTRVNTLTSSAKATLASAKVSAFTNLPRALSSCNSTYFTNPQKLEDCIFSNIDTYAAIVQASLRLVDKNLDASICSASDLSIDAIQCSTVTQRNAILTIGKVMQSIEYCLKDEEIVCNCPLVPATSVGNRSNTTTTSAPRQIN